ncbi:MAG: hypothetical protein AAF721_38140 [Myxococcota bacterium]
MSDARLSRRLALALELLGAALAVATVVLFRDCVVDDAYIGLRYADNLLRGDGLVYNVGERVEGITNLGFTVVVAGLGRLGVDLLVAARFLGLLGAVFAVWLAPPVVLPGDERRVQRAVVRLLCLANFAFVYLAWTGLETGAFAGLVCAAAYRQSRAALRFDLGTGVLAGAAFAVRPEGIIIVVVGVGIASWRHGGGATLRTAGTWVAGSFVVAVEAFRLQYYGSLVPNTARVKGLLSVGTPDALPWYGTFGDDFVEMFSQTGGAVALLLVVIALARPHDGPRAWLAAFTVAGFAVFEIYAGGDWMLGYRYLLPMIPLYLSLAVAGGALALQHAVPQTSARWRALAVASVVVVAGYCWSFGLRFRQDITAYPQFVMTSRDMTTAGRWLSEHYPPDTTITCWRIGALGYYSRLRVIDTNGLTDADVASALHDPAALRRRLAERRPALSIVRGRPGEPAARQLDLHGTHYHLVRVFPQGSAQTWQLYERDALDTPK